LLWALVLAASWSVVLAAPALAHGEADARPVVRNVSAGPYSVSLWQVDGDAASGIPPHLIVMFDGAMPTTGVAVTVNATPLEAHLSATTPNAWETSQGVAIGDQVAVTISEAAQVWTVGPVVVPTPPTFALPMKEIVLASILITIRAAWWAAMRTRKVWRGPDAVPAEATSTKLREGSLAG
jgi:hypothetical protein